MCTVRLITLSELSLINYRAEHVYMLSTKFIFILRNNSYWNQAALDWINVVELKQHLSSFKVDAWLDFIWYDATDPDDDDD